MDTFTIDVKIDLKKDAWNYWGAFNKNTHSAQRKDHIAKINFDFDILKGVNVDDAYPLMKEYLENFWEENKDLAEQRLTDINEGIQKVKDAIFSKMQHLTHHPIYRNTFTIYLTSLSRGPYSYQEGYSLTCIFRKHYITPFIHELLHFQTIHYYKEHIMTKVNDEKKFEDLKEALTFLLNYEFKDLLDGYDMGYPQHQELRRQLETYRFNSDKDFDKLVDYGCDLLSS